LTISPKEFSTKGFVPQIRNVTKDYQIKKAASRDPRFLTTEGSTSVVRDAEEEYAFLKDMQQEELEDLQTRLKSRSLDENAKHQIQRNINKLVCLFHYH
jgi:hypothetical protein